ncbi:MAG: RNA polymerase sigma factor [Roseibium sp.]|uniref:RNA polymerase sigma factor n=1 Tax=Roseibium sp. TaxID=1936156 RepID=UPI00262E631F|nr:RNA polymerase sigma factor [Roseibium sp.]MCV0425413.1 RNA polymerase sigma factor [Roseibium sp.]
MSRFEDNFVQDLQTEMPHLRRYARSVTGSAEAGEDLMQTALERALRNRAQFTHGTELRRWLFTIVRNAHLDEIRKYERRGHHVPIEEWYEETHFAPTQEKYLELGDVAKNIERLRPEERDVLQLCVFSGLSHDQVANRMGVAVGTVKSRLSRARQALAA